jgi:Class II flagellar assembly regulator
MKIDGTSGPKGPNNVKRTAKAGGAGQSSFAKHLGETEGEGASITGSNGIGGISALIALQQVDGAGDERQRGRKRAQDLLDQLDELRHFLLMGAIPRDKLLDLAQMAQSQRALVEDPTLQALFDEIDLRAQVELAKYSPFPTHPHAHQRYAGESLAKKGGEGE